MHPTCPVDCTGRKRRKEGNEGSQEKKGRKKSTGRRGKERKEGTGRSQ
jgi:hypothetical protein